MMSITLPEVTVIKHLVEQLNIYRDAYYNNNESLVTDLEYDDLFDQLCELEKKTGIILSNSPTQTVGYEVKSELEEVIHSFPPMLSLDKSKDINDIYKFLSHKDSVVMAKMDGLTCRITYNEGKLVRAETRGDGYRGEDITHNIKVVKDVPLSIKYKGEVIVDGELIIRRDNFLKIKNKFVDSKGKTYKNPRNFASGSVRLHDSEQCKDRDIQFVAWKFVKGSTTSEFSLQLNELNNLGFRIVPYMWLSGECSPEQLKHYSDQIETECKLDYYPIDGCVFSFDDCNFMESLGYTSHHSRAQIAYKFYDELYDTKIRSIDWTMGKTGALTPTAVFDTVEIDGTDVSRASLHNLTIMKQLNVRKDCTARVFKANMIIPQVNSVDDDGVADFEIPKICPVCGGNTRVTKENDSEVLICSNPNCKGKLLGKCCTFVSKQGMDIDGLGESSLETYINLGIINKLSDIFRLKDHYYFIGNLEGWTTYSVDKLMNAIEASKDVSLEKFISALSIPNIGLASAKTIAKHFDYNVSEFYDAITGNYAWSLIDGFGEKTEQDIYDWYHDNKDEFEDILSYVRIKVPPAQTPIVTNSPVSGKTFCITGTFNSGKREALKTKIEQLGGIFVDGVTKKTDILFVGDKAGSKLKKAQDLNIIIYDESKLIELLEEN